MEMKNTVLPTARPQELIRLTPSAPSRSWTAERQRAVRRRRRRQAGPGSISKRSAGMQLGITSVMPAGRGPAMSMKRQAVWLILIDEICAGDLPGDDLQKIAVLGPSRGSLAAAFRRRAGTATASRASQVARVVRQLVVRSRSRRVGRLGQLRQQARRAVGRARFPSGLCELIARDRDSWGDQLARQCIPQHLRARRSRSGITARSELPPRASPRGRRRLSNVNVDLDRFARREVAVERCARRQRPPRAPGKPSRRWCAVSAAAWLIRTPCWHVAGRGSRAPSSAPPHIVVPKNARDPWG